MMCEKHNATMRIGRFDLCDRCASRRGPTKKQMERLIATSNRPIKEIL